MAIIEGTNASLQSESTQPLSLRTTPTFMLVLKILHVIELSMLLLKYHYKKLLYMSYNDSTFLSFFK